MILKPISQINLYGLNKFLNELIQMYEKKKLPTKILLSGQKGLGKSTLAYHLINFVLSKNEKFCYELSNNLINTENKSFKLIQNGTNPNFILIDVLEDKKSIDINQVRNLINNLQKSSFNESPRFVLIDNIENLNLNSINAFLKILEEPTKNTYFILIHNNKKITPTLLSRCLNFKVNLSNKEIISVSNQLLEVNVKDLINNDLLDYYFTPGKIYKLVQFSKENKIDLKQLDLKKFLDLMIKNYYYKKDNNIKQIIYDYIELFLLKKISLLYADLYSYFIQRIKQTRKFNLDEESLFLEIKSKLLNG